MENYLETIYLVEKEHGHAHIKDIAQAIKISMPSVNQALKKLKKAKLLDSKRYGPVHLTEKGRSVAEKIFQRHKIISDFLCLVLGADRRTAEEDACRIEHILSLSTFEKLQSFMATKT